MVRFYATPVLTPEIPTPPRLFAKPPHFPTTQFFFPAVRARSMALLCDAVARAGRPGRAFRGGGGPAGKFVRPYNKKIVYEKGCLSKGTPSHYIIHAYARALFVIRVSIAMKGSHAINTDRRLMRGKMGNCGYWWELMGKRRVTGSAGWSIPYIGQTSPKPIADPIHW